jgi:hypothetical protein
MIRPERDETLDKGPIGRHTLRERGTAFGCRDTNERATRLLPSLAPLQIVCLGNGSERANRIGDRLGGAFNWRVEYRGGFTKLCAEPAARVPQLPAFAGASAKSEPVQRAKSLIHEMFLSH